MPIDDLSASRELLHRDGRFFRAGRDEVLPSNGSLEAHTDGYLYFAGDPFPPGGAGTYRVGEVQDDVVTLYPGLVLDRLPDGSRRLRIGYRYLGTYRLS